MKGDAVKELLANGTIRQRNRRTNVMIVNEGEIRNIYDLHVATAGFLEQLIGRELDSEEFNELLRLIRAMGRIARNSPEAELDEFADFEQ